MLTVSEITTLFKHMSIPLEPIPYENKNSLIDIRVRFLKQEKSLNI